MTQSGPNRFADRLRRALMGFAAARGREILGIALMAAALALTAAMLGHNAADPSLNHSTPAAAQNPLGFYGATAADIFVQYIGLGAFLGHAAAFRAGLAAFTQAQSHPPVFAPYRRPRRYGFGEHGLHALSFRPPCRHQCAALAKRRFAWHGAGARHGFYLCSYRSSPPMCTAHSLY